jgi:hypothetical protein
MSASGNAELVRRAYATSDEADIEALAALIDENASWCTPGRSPVAGVYQGRDAVVAQLRRYGGDTGGTFRLDLKQVFTSDDGRVIGLHHSSGERNGRRLDTDCCVVFEVVDGRVVSGREHVFDLARWDAFWS